MGRRPRQKNHIKPNNIEQDRSRYRLGVVLGIKETLKIGSKANIEWCLVPFEGSNPTALGLRKYYESWLAGTTSLNLRTGAFICEVRSG